MNSQHVNENRIYSDLYDIINLRLCENRKLYLSKELYSIFAVTPITILDYQKVKDLDNCSFFSAVHYALWRIMPDEATLQLWEDDIANLPKEEFQIKAMHEFIDTIPSVVHGSKITNCNLEIRSNSPIVPPPPGIRKLIIEKIRSRIKRIFK